MYVNKYTKSSYSKLQTVEPATVLNLAFIPFVTDGMGTEGWWWLLLASVFGSSTMGIWVFLRLDSNVQQQVRQGVRLDSVSVWIARWLGEVEPRNCFLKPPNTLSNYVLGGQLYTVYIRFTL